MKKNYIAPLAVTYKINTKVAILGLSNSNGTNALEEEEKAIISDDDDVDNLVKAQNMWANEW